MKKHEACIATYEGWVDIDIEQYRTINCVKKPLHENIFNSKFYKDKEGIFWPKITKIENYTSSFNNAISYYNTEFIHHITRYPEFTPTQFKDVLLFLCDVCIYCMNNGYWLRTHLWNITYVRGHPYLIDIRDFETYNNHNWNCIFLGHFRQQLDNHCPVPVSNFVVNHLDITNKLNNCSNNLNDIKSIINEIIIVNNNNAQWTNYHGNRTNFLNDYNSLTNELYEKIKNYGGGSKDATKSVNLLNAVEKLDVKTILEMGCNNGLYSFACSKNAHVVGVDYDMNSINLANNINKKLNTNTVFIHCNILDENQLSQTYGQNGAYNDIYTRFRSELLIAPAIIHHLYPICNSTDKIISIFDKFAKKYMIIELIPDIINKTSLISSIKKFNWNIIEELPSSPNPRKWLICEKL